MKKFSIKQSVFSLLCVCISMVNSAHGQALNFSNTPLTISSAVDPNIMLLLDTSGSMSNILVDAPYDRNVEYGPCTSGVSNSSEISIRIDNQGRVYFFRAGQDQDWGLNGGTGNTNKPAVCFSRTDTYNAFLFANRSNGSVRFPGGYLSGQYEGNYLNWYFSNAANTTGDDFGNGNRKPGTETRITTARDSAANLVTSLSNVRMGLARYNGSSGARIVNVLADMDDNTAKTSLLSSINSLNNGGFTPLAESLEQVGRYYAQISTLGSGQQIQLHPVITRDPVSGEITSITGDPNDLTGAHNIFSRPNYTVTNDEPASLTDAAIQYSCQKSFTVLLTDGRATQDTNVNSRLRDYDDDCSGANSSNCSVNDRKNSPLYSYESTRNGGSDYLDDVAQALFEIDLRPDLDNADGSEEINNVLTYVIGFADPSVANDQLLKDTALQGGTSTPFFPSNSAELATAFEDITNSIFNQVGSAASVSFNTATLSANSALYQPGFNTGRWSGNLLAFVIDENSGSVANTITWDAADVLDGQSPANRNIYTYDPVNNDGTTFEWANLSTSQRDDLGYTDGTTTDLVLGEQVLNYLRGDRSSEGGATGDLRVRTHALGDLVNSSPVYVGQEVGQSWPDHSENNLFGASTTGNSYSDFAQSSLVTNRTPVVYVGANDGMLHGFNGSLSGTGAGEEVMAYIPNAVYDANANSGLHFLADQDYNHKFYVDLSPTVSDVFISRGSYDFPDIEAGTDGTNTITRDWRTVLIGGLRSGGRGLFALDVTNPAEFGTSNIADDLVLWEFTSDDDADLGYTFSQPTIVMTKAGWMAIVGNGYNNSGDGTAKLFALRLEGGLDGVWTKGTDYYELETYVGDNDAATTVQPNGMSTPRVADLDGDSVADRVYVGDLQGNMWAFDISDNNPANWGSAYNSLNGVIVTPATAGPVPLFKATNGSNQAQPITSPPILANNPNSVNGAADDPNVLVMFGTGRFIQSSDINNYTDVMSYYSVWDKGTGELTRSGLESRSLNTPADNSSRTVTGSAIDWSLKFGWYFDLTDNNAVDTNGVSVPAQGERVVSRSLLRGGILFFNTIIPESDACTAGGSGYLMSIDFDSGLASSNGVFDGNGDGIIDSNDANFVGAFFDSGVPAGSGILGDKRFTPGSGSRTVDGKKEVPSLEEDSIVTPSSGNLGRLSWEELLRSD